jgi:TetR/AcrR family transcriptional regulator
MENIDKSTEELILDAARQIFINKGLAGARMQEIADKAGINKALLHYYFRSKEKLFEAVFEEVFRQFIPQVGKLIADPADMEEVMGKVIILYSRMIRKNPFIPQFIISELNRNPFQLDQPLLERMGLIRTADQFLNQINEKIKPDFDARHVLVSVLAMIIFPYVARPLLQTVLFDGNPDAFEAFLDEREKIVPEMVRDIIKNNSKQ